MSLKNCEYVVLPPIAILKPLLGQQIADLRSAFEARNEADKNLTATDLLTVACGADYLATHGALLCREMFCRLQTNGAGAAQSECEEIANVANFPRQLFLSSFTSPQHVVNLQISHKKILIWGGMFHARET